MHLIGGFWISAATLTFRAMRAPTVIDSVPLLLAYAVTATLVIGLGWEVFEWGVDRMNGLVHFDLVDTSADMGNDLIGALFAAWVFLRTRYNKAI